jgi:glutathione S-transferase
MITCPAARHTSSWRLPCAGNPRRVRSSTGLMAWSMALRNACESALHTGDHVSALSLTSWASIAAMTLDSKLARAVRFWHSAKMQALELVVVSLRYSSWSMRAWLALTQAAADFRLRTVELPALERRGAPGSPLQVGAALREQRRPLGSVTGSFPVLWIGETPLHESLAICEWVAEAYPDAGLWPAAPLARALARAVSCEMATSFANIRGELSCHLLGHVSGFQPSAAAAAEIARVFELWEECLQRSSGPFLFGSFGIADCMYYPMLTRFSTYGVELPSALLPYATAVNQVPAVQELRRLARQSPRIPVYDEYLRSLGGDPDAAAGT